MLKKKKIFENVRLRHTISKTSFLDLGRHTFSKIPDFQKCVSHLSRTGYVIMYANCTIHWVSRLQTEIALSTAKAEYLALSQALRNVIPLTTLL